MHGKGFFTADMDRFKEYVAHDKPMEYAIEFYNQKPLKECSLREVLDGIGICGRMSNWFDTISYVDEGDHYTLKIYHSMGPNTSKMYQMLFESLFNTYGVKFDSKVTENTLFMMVNMPVIR